MGTDSVMSSDLIWQLVRGNSCFLVKKGGRVFTTEPNNLLQINSPKYSGLSNKKVLGVDAADKGVTVTTTKRQTSRNPNKHLVKTSLKKDVARSLKAVKSISKAQRPDLQNVA